MSIKTSIFNALRKNLLPGVVLQCFAAIIMGLYFLIPSLQPYYEIFGELKETYGFGYSFVATALFGGLIPFLYLLINKQLSQVNMMAIALFYILFWGLKGMEVDLFYRYQAAWFGSGNDLPTLATKVAVDQFIYSALWAAPSITLSYLWMEQGFSFSRWNRALDKQFFSMTLPTVIFSNWMVWIPAVSIVYAMPSQLQIPLFNLVLCFWVLLLAILNKRS